MFVGGKHPQESPIPKSQCWPPPVLLLEAAEPLDPLLAEETAEPLALVALVPAVALVPVVTLVPVVAPVEPDPVAEVVDVAPPEPP